MQEFSISLEDSDDELEFTTPGDDIRTIHTFSTPHNMHKTGLIGSAIVVISFLSFALFSTIFRETLLEESMPKAGPLADWQRIIHDIKTNTPNTKAAAPILHNYKTEP